CNIVLPKVSKLPCRKFGGGSFQRCGLQQPTLLFVCCAAINARRCAGSIDDAKIDTGFRNDHTLSRRKLSRRMDSISNARRGSDIGSRSPVRLAITRNPASANNSSHSSCERKRTPTLKVLARSD